MAARSYTVCPALTSKETMMNDAILDELEALSKKANELTTAIEQLDAEHHTLQEEFHETQSQILALLEKALKK